MYKFYFVFGPLYSLDKIYSGLGSVFYFYYISKLFFNIIYFYKFLTKDYDLINIHHIFSAPSQKLIKTFKIPVVLTLHTYFTYELFSRGRLKKSSFFVEIAFKYEKRAYDSVSHIITVDTRLRDYLIDLGVK